MDIEIGRAKRGRRAYSFDDLAIVPSRRTRDPEEVSVAWQIDAYRFELPIMYKAHFNRTGIRNDGVAAYSRVHYGNSYENAFWDDSCFCMPRPDTALNTGPYTEGVFCHTRSTRWAHLSSGFDAAGCRYGLAW